MPFLFVDYDQGSGGEYFCSCLGQSPQSEILEFKKFDSGRTKVRDVFGQEFLKPTPSPDTKILSDTAKYTIVPTHQHTNLAKELFGDIRSIRIKHPGNNVYFKFLKHQQITKTLLATEPTGAYFLGFLKILSQEYNNTNFLSKVHRSMDNLSLILIAQGLDPTEENRQNYITKLKIFDPEPEPNFEYDLTIEYEALFCNPESIVDQLTQCFGLEVDLALLKKYQTDFEQYQTHT